MSFFSKFPFIWNFIRYKHVKFPRLHFKWWFLNKRTKIQATSLYIQVNVLYVTDGQIIILCMKRFSCESCFSACEFQLIFLWIIKGSYLHCNLQCEIFLRWRKYRVRTCLKSYIALPNINPYYFGQYLRVYKSNCQVALESNYVLYKTRY